MTDDGRVRPTQIYDSEPTLTVCLTSVFQEYNPKSPEVNVWVKHHRSCCTNIYRDPILRVVGAHEASHDA